MSDPWADSKFLSQQYGESTRKLNDRVALYERFFAGPVPWYDWLYERLCLSDRESIADVGCGTGNLWLRGGKLRTTVNRIVLIDQSPVMVRECRHRFDATPNVTVLEGDAQDLLVREKTQFDRIVVSHVLYHVSDSRTFLEFCLDSLAANGRLIITTVGARHLWQMWEYLHDFAQQEGIRLAHNRLPFSNANELLALRDSSCDIDLVEYKAHLLVTEATPLVSYILSTGAFPTIGDRQLLQASLTTFFGRALAHGGSFRLDVHNWLATMRHR